MRTNGSALVRGLFGWIGLAAGIGGGWYAHELTGSWALAVFVFAMTTYVLGRGVPDVITDPDKGRRIAFFGLPPIIGIAGLAGSYQLWETWWLAVVIGFVAYFIGFIVASMAFPRIAEEEHADDRSRLGLGLEPSTRSSREARRISTEEASRVLAAVEETGVSLSPDERQRFIGLLEEGDPQAAMALVTEKVGHGTATRAPGVSDKYANLKF